jgi:hypothetical protein
MRCSSCGSGNREGRKFCAGCGVVEETGAKTYEPFVYVERADLARLTGDEAIHERGLRELIGCFSKSVHRSARQRSRRNSARVESRIGTAQEDGE